MTMMTFGLVSLIGITLGFRFSVMVLFPAIGVALLYVACIEVGRGDGGGQVVLTMISTAAALQVGYLVGIVLHSIAVFSVAPAARKILVQGR
jgi:uncharacterized membrane protein